MSYFTLPTAIGAAEFVNAKIAGLDVPFTHMAFGDGNGAEVNPDRSMTALVREVHRVPISSITRDPVNPDWMIVEAVIPTTVGGWTVRETGIIGGISAGGRLLIVGNFPASYKPTLAEGSARDMLVRMFVQIGAEASVRLIVNPGVVIATEQTVSNAIAAHEAKADPHPQYLRKAQRGVADGVASLDSSGQVPLSQLPPAIATDVELAASLSAHVDPTQDPHSQYLTVARMNALLLGARAKRFFHANI